MNEYLSLFRKVMKMHLEGYEEIRLRRELTRKYSWAVPNKRAIRTIAKYSPIIEIGAGTGYWAMLLKKHGVDIIAYDLYPFKENLYHNSTQWFPVKKGSFKILEDYSRRNLFLCWPFYNDIMALECLKEFKGDILIYIGEKINGCNATNEFFEDLEKRFKLIKKVNIPQWWRLYDYLTVWKRRI